MESLPEEVEPPSSPGNNEPRSRRVGVILPLSLSYESTTPSSSPPIPSRSPLRPSARPVAVVESSPDMPLPMLSGRSFGSFSTLVDSLSGAPFVVDPPKSISPVPSRTPSPDKPLPVPPNVLVDALCIEEPLETPASTKTTFSKSSSGISKRTHALHELLSSERAYASDLALIRDVHIPLALGQQAPFPMTPPQSSSSSGRTLSTASDSSTASSLGVPMSREDTRIIFSNIADLALFSDTFSERLEEALGSVLEGGQGEDHVGAVFIEMIPLMEPPYKAYITHHPVAVEHLNKLPQTAALTAYLAYTRTLAASLTHAWDLPSLLIKPVQRLLKYSLLLNAIIDDTPDSHGDKENLRKAKVMMEVVSHAVNEGQRRREVVKEVLSIGKPNDVLKKKGLSLATVGLGKIKGSKAAISKTENEEAEQVEQMERQLRDSSAFVTNFAKDTLDWAKAIQVLTIGLRDWALSFGRVIGLSPESNSEAFDAFKLVVDPQLMELCADLQGLIQEQLLPQLRSLVDSSNTPICLLDAMHALEPHHHALLNHNISKGRPSPALLDASRSYVALRSQLHEELPRYISLLRRGISFSIQQVSKWQAQFWKDVRERWSELWDALRVEGEMNAGSEETERVWKHRWAEVERDMLALNIVHPEKIQLKARATTTPTTIRTLAVTSMFSALEPASASTSASFMDSSSASRGRSSTASSSRRKLGRQPSQESIRSAKSGKSSTNGGRGILEDILPPSSRVPPAQHAPRRQSMPVPLRKASSQSVFVQSPVQDPSLTDDRGRSDRKSSLKSNFLDTMDNLRPSISRRSSSRNSTSQKTRPPVSPHSASFSSSSYAPVPPPVRLTVSSKWLHAPALYSCRVIHACDPPEGVSYYGLPFFQLFLGDVFAILKEAGHPSRHQDLPLYVDDGDDCLLLARDERGDLGWVLASFLYPVD
ncbi:hypothetical protein BV25DRAFT_1826155 [Artomyces pyxidatus]|uniref:Uncharacterized protein n=1 Tax=Artomyces pyxidatus TaxID=48021 RepID=A0ACB8T181_9AGAM|nr:hypothetical protein BV25DRAFT_1826155 [Artomyces pyxidatus]